VARGIEFEAVHGISGTQVDKVTIHGCQVAWRERSGTPRGTHGGAISHTYRLDLARLSYSRLGSQFNLESGAKEGDMEQMVLALIGRGRVR
jgi:hypothetical protein